MALSRSELREKCMIILYQYDIMTSNHIKENIDDIIKNNIDIENEFVKDVVYGVITNMEAINNLANKYMVDWNIDRLDKTGATILRIGIYELMYTDTPSLVVINEALELAKKYSEDAVRKMINAVLDKISKDK